MLDILGPDGALDVHQDPGLGALELHHHDGGEVAALVPVWEVIAREAAERSVCHLQKEFMTFNFSAYSYQNSGYFSIFRQR